MSAAQLFDDVEIDEDEPGAPAPAPTDFHSPGVYVPPPAADADVPDWPAGICTAEEAGDALERALGGIADSAHPLNDLATRTLDSLSDLERAVLSGEPQPVDAAPIRKAAVMRLRVADALTSAPAPGSPVDSAALSTILGDIDALLAEVAPLLSSAPPELAPALEAIRNSLVSEAIDFSEAASRVSGQPEAPAAAPQARPATRGARVLSVTSGEVEPSRWNGKTIALIAILALVAAGVGVYHVRRMMPRPAAPMKTLPGAPAGTTGMSRNGVQIYTRMPGQTVDPAELERFRAAQEAKGNTVQEIGKGVWLVKPADAKGGTP